jgi:hypothetical protein
MQTSNPHRPSGLDFQGRSDQAHTLSQEVRVLASHSLIMIAQLMGRQAARLAFRSSVSEQKDDVGTTDGRRSSDSIKNDET